MVGKPSVSMFSLFIFFCCALSAYAEDGEMAELKEIVLQQNKKIDALMKRIEELEKRQEQDSAQMTSVAVQNDEQQVVLNEISSRMEDIDELRLDWVNKIQFSGDFRYRYEYIDEEGGDNRNRNRIRARIGMEANLSDELDIILRLATGNSPDQVSTNQTLTDSFTSKDIWLDLAYFHWHPEKFDGLNLYGGKMKNPFFKPGGTEMLWDDDLTPEGLAIEYEKHFGDIELFGSAGGFWIQERSSDGDSALWGAQAGVKFNLSDEVYILGGGSYYNYTNMKDQTVFGISEEPSGNSSYMIGSDYYYLGEYALLEGFAELGLNIGGCPVTIFGDYVKNSEFDDENTGYLIGAEAGKTKDPGSWSVRWNYRRVESDSVVAAFTDSDFTGGTTNGKGHELGVNYQLTKPVRLGLTYFMNEKGLDIEREYDRLQLDVVYKF